MGHIDDNFSFKAQVDFASGEAEFRSVYGGVSGVPVLGNLRIGNQREPFGLERNTGTHYVTMMERASLSTLSAGRNTGIMFHDAPNDGRMSWAVGLFRDTNEQGFGQGDDGIAGTARLTGTSTSVALEGTCPSSQTAVYGQVAISANLLPAARTP